MSNSVSVTLSSNDIYSLIKSLSASNLYHNNLDDSNFSYPNEKQEIIANHKRLQDHLKTHLDNTPFCPCPPETSDTALSSTDDVDGGNPFSPSPETSSCAVKCELDGVKGDSFSKSYPKKQDITYLQALKDIKAQIEFLNKCAFDKSILTSDEHFALLGIEEELNQLIHFDSIRPADDGLPLRYDHFNCFSLPDNLE